MTYIVIWHTYICHIPVIWHVYDMYMVIYHLYICHINGLWQVYSWYIPGGWCCEGGHGPIPPDPPAITSPGLVTTVIFFTSAPWHLLLLAMWMWAARTSTKKACKPLFSHVVHTSKLFWLRHMSLTAEKTLLRPRAGWLKRKLRLKYTVFEPQIQAWPIWQVYDWYIPGIYHWNVLARTGVAHSQEIARAGISWAFMGFFRV